MKFIGIVKTSKNEEYLLKTDTFMEAWNFLHETVKPLGRDALYAAVHQDIKWNDGHYMHPSKEIAVMRRIP